MAVARRRISSVMMAVSMSALLAGCVDGLDFDMRGAMGGGLDTSDAALGVTAPRPDADDRGVISYPNYQVAVARRGDTVADVANRVGLRPEAVADYNSLAVNDRLRAGEVVLLPDRVAEPSQQTGGSGQVIPPSNVDISSLAGTAINNAQDPIASETLEPAPQPLKPSDVQIGYEPIRHTVKRGETAFSIARLYNVSVRALSEWNGLGSDFTIRERQILLIPPAQPGAPSTSSRPQVRDETVSQPGQGSSTPTPPSASKPLPKDDTAQPVKAPEAPKLQQTASAAQMSYPLDGKIIRTFKKGKNNGIDISAPAGTSVKAAASGTVAAITTDADDVTIIVVRHPNNVMTVYYNVADVSVSKGTKVSREQTMAKVPAKNNFLHFEVRKGFEIVDPMPFLK